MLSAELSLGLLLLIPLAASVLIGLFGKHQNLREAVTFVAGFALLANVIYLVKLVASGVRPELLIGTFAGSFELKLVLELFTMGYMRGNKEKNQTRFFLFVAIAIAAAMGIAASGNLITLFIFYEVLTLSTFPLVAHKGDAKARKGGTIYGLILMGTSLAFLLPAVIGTHVIAGTTDFKVGGVCFRASPCRCRCEGGCVYNGQSCCLCFRAEPRG